MGQWYVRTIVRRNIYNKIASRFYHETKSYYRELAYLKKLFGLAKSDDSMSSPVKEARTARSCGKTSYSKSCRYTNNFFKTN